MQFQFNRSKTTMGRPQAKIDYENLRNARILENQARLTSLGLHKTISELRSIASSRKPAKTHVSKRPKKPNAPALLRRSDRLRGGTTDGELLQLSDGPKIRGQKKDRRSVYHPFGIVCHVCGNKMLCIEEDCKRCGKTDCSACHSSRGVLCRRCVEVRLEGSWMCPHCIEEKGANPYWICNRPSCLKERKMVPLKPLIYKCQEMGYKSVAHMLMDELQRAEKKRAEEMQT